MSWLRHFWIISHSLYRRWSRYIPFNHNILLIIVAHAQKQTTASQENGQPRLLLLLLPDHNRSGSRSQKQPCICVRRLAFSEEIHFSLFSTALSVLDSLVSTKIVCACIFLFSPPSQTVNLWALLLTASGLCASHQDKSTSGLNAHR